MNKNHCFLPVVSALTLTASLAFGQSDEAPVAPRLDSPKIDLEQYRVSCRLAYNISARLESIGTTAAASTYPVSVTGLTYQDGYVARDSSGNVGDRTWYWGYANNNQIAGDNLLLSHSVAGPVQDIKNEPQAGLEVSYSRQLGDYQGTKWGIEGTFDYMELDFRAHGLANPQVLAVDAFPLNGVVPPLAPYSGSYAGPGPLLGATPTRYPVNVVTEINATVYGLKLGPYLEFELVKKVWLGVSGGFALVLADSDFRIQQSLSLPGQVTHLRSVGDSGFGALPGCYFGGRLSHTITDSVSVFTAVQYESTGHQTHTAGDKRADIDFWNAIYFSFGFSYSF